MRGTKRNTAAYTGLAWGGFVAFISIYGISVYNLEVPLAVKGLFATLGIALVMSSITLQKVVRDNQEDTKIGIDEVD
ncbi:hypothetical protein BEP19_10850 [Ammoniphilus oxalaticus]|uniref:YiaAB two helix domain-containing protein n=1 Tax=Ammoniphilus oxalaticus TaxID=66863 RepID=A0A419SG24_9BACL|nr:YiaA/YiaB family inner membrane protein [Ammoniphilus oxalaticus]RKD22741.1 hypothetical protein BEP19_10850 [Ammoniphilus oxalaticus]